MDECGVGVPDCPRPTCHPSILGDGGATSDAPSPGVAGDAGRGVLLTPSGLAATVISTAILGAALGGYVASNLLLRKGVFLRRKPVAGAGNQRAGGGGGGDGVAEEWEGGRVVVSQSSGGVGRVQRVNPLQM